MLADGLIVVVGKASTRSWILWDGQCGDNEGAQVTPGMETQITFGGRRAGLIRICVRVHLVAVLCKTLCLWFAVGRLIIRARTDVQAAPSPYKLRV